MRAESAHRPENPESFSEESFQEIPENQTAYSKYEDVRLVDTAYENPRSAETLSEAELEGRIRNFESMVELAEYRSLPLNFGSLDGAAERFAESDEAAGHEQLAQELRNAVSDIKFSVSDYYKAVMVFERTNMNKYRLEPEEHLEKMEKVNQHRTLMHNRLIDDVVRYTRLCNKVIPEKTGFRFTTREMFDPHLVLDLRSQDEGTHGTARRRIANWAFLNERGIHIEKAMETLQGVLDKKKAAPEDPKPQEPKGARAKPRRR